MSYGVDKKELGLFKVSVEISLDPFVGHNYFMKNADVTMAPGESKKLLCVIRVFCC